MMIFWRPGNLYWERRRASRAKALSVAWVSMTVAACRGDRVERTGVTSTDRHDDLADVDTGDSAVGLTPGTTHTSLKSIGTSARQHLVDTDDVVRVDTDTEVETLLTGGLDEVLVGANTGGLKGLRAQLLILVGDHVDAEREVIDGSALAAKIEDANLGVGDTTVEARLRVRLERGTWLANCLCVVVM